MEDFKRLVLPGILFSALGLRWTYSVLMRHYLVRSDAALGDGPPRLFANSLTFPSSCKPGAPVEAIVVLVAVSLEFAGELVMSFDRFELLAGGTHMTALFFFIVAFTVAVLTEYRILTMPKLDYALMALAFLVKAFLFYSNAFGSGDLETQLHMDIVHLCVILAGCLSLEAAFPHSVLVSLVRGWSVTLLGSWLLQIAFFLYYPYPAGPWYLQGVDHMEKATLVLMWHIAGNFLLVFAMTSFVMYRVRNMSPQQVQEALDITYFTSSHCFQKSGGKEKYLVTQTDAEGV